MRRLILKLLRRRRLQRDLEAELAFHEELSALRGNPIRLGNTAIIQERARDLWRFNALENLWRDVVYGIRALRRSPALVLSAILSLGLGIGANLAIFSLAVEFLLSEPSVRDSASVVSVSMAGNSHSSVDVMDAVRKSGVFADVAGLREEVFVNWNDGAQTRPLFSFMTTKNYFTALGVPVAYGRSYVPGDPDEVVLLSHHFWRTRFNGDPSSVGRTMILDGRAYTIVGVLPASHRTMIGFGVLPDVYLPRFADANFALYARLKTGMSIDQAKAGLGTIAAGLDLQGPDRRSKGYGGEVRPIAGFARLFSQAQELTTVAVFFLMLLFGVGVVLLIACVNVAGLLLARASVRRREIAIRLALGAGRRRLLQQLLVESSLLAILGTSAGLGLARAIAILIGRVPVPAPIPIHIQIQADWRVALYATALAVLATLACGLLPAVQSIRPSISADLPRHGKLRLRRMMVAGQIAVSAVALAAGFLFLRNLLQSNAIDPGFDVRQTVMAQVYLSPVKYGEDQLRALYFQQALETLRALPGIEGVAAAQVIPFRNQVRMGSLLTFPDTGEQVRTSFQWNSVTREYFQVMGIPVLQGASIETDRQGGPNAVVVNRIFVERYLGARPPVGAVFLWGSDGKTPYQIVGVVQGTKNRTLGEADVPQLYELSRARTYGDGSPIQFLLRSTTPPVTQLEIVRTALRQIEPDAGIEVDTLYSGIAFAFFPSQVGAVLMGSVGSLALMLAAVGLYGTMIYSVTRRTHEIGVRMAIGATRRDISSMVVFESIKLIALGSAIGLALAFVVTRPLATFFVPGLKPADPASLFLVLLVLAAMGVIASWGPSRRASSIDPILCLRHD